MGRDVARYQSGMVVTLGGRGRAGGGASDAAGVLALTRLEEAREGGGCIWVACRGFAAPPYMAAPARCAAAAAAPALMMTRVPAVASRRSAMCCLAVTSGRPGMGKSHDPRFMHLYALICERRRSSCGLVNPERTRKFCLSAAARSAADAPAAAPPGAGRDGCPATPSEERPTTAGLAPAPAPACARRSSREGNA